MEAIDEDRSTPVAMRSTPASAHLGTEARRKGFLHPALRLAGGTPALPVKSTALASLSQVKVPEVARFADVRVAKGQRYIEINPRYMENHAAYVEITIQFSTHTEKNVEMCPLCVENSSSCIENYVSYIEMFAASPT
jgi:hypothetical protein